MSDDLISRKTIKSQIETIRDCWGTNPFVSSSDMKLYAETFNVVLQTISDCHTAFDKEKMIELIKALSAGIILNTNISDDYAEGYVRSAKDIIEIIEKGEIGGPKYKSKSRTADGSRENGRQDRRTSSCIW